MRRLLLDTHALLWFIDGSNQLSTTAKALIENPENEIYVSMTSFFEITIKLKLGKLKLRKSLQGIYQDTISETIQVLPISAEHIFEYQNNPIIDVHKDPFDKLIISTAIVEDLTIITVDNKFELYKPLINILW